MHIPNELIGRSFKDDEKGICFTQDTIEFFDANTDKVEHYFILKDLEEIK